MPETRRITFDSGPVGRALAQALQEEGVTVTGPTRPTTEYRDARDVIEGVVTPPLADGAGSGFIASGGGHFFFDTDDPERWACPRCLATGSLGHTPGSGGAPKTLDSNGNARRE